MNGLLKNAHRGSWLLFILAALMLTGCMSSAKSVPSRYSLVFDADAKANAEAPVKVRVLLLRSDAEFMDADFFSLQNDAKSVLGNSLLDSDQFFLTPGQKGKKLGGQSTLETRYIGIIAEYQQLDGKVWRMSLPLPEPTETNFYKVWQFSPDELEAHIIAGINGLHTAEGKK
ncbi:type VI secretion system lipoprotein TssJ [Enterobacillus tribolii]|uniref:Type VI secretion system protein VasD n=1 Tax=Enterobacillus tribolii TaxID=1487935 RepID=A0A370Q6W5_9GAMM|nr:type VI secretion system lipoprotein TssJ [Enterobacillus tribolii]MBW7984906.1 type VI secretion system lipoprotein TssJ [Enterobacillus tribolii]RDK84118.1 type VI secretion system protein VasD [Enterobacillus tribolii]